MEVMSKFLSKSDTKNKRLEFPAKSLWAFPMPAGKNSLKFVAFDMLDKPWRLKVSVRKGGKHEKPWLNGQWDAYVKHRGLRKGDKVLLIMHEQENGGRIYHIRAERKHFGFWYSIDQWQPTFSKLAQQVGLNSP